MIQSDAIESHFILVIISSMPHILHANARDTLQKCYVFFLHKISMKLTSDKQWEVKMKKLKLKAHKMCLHTRKPGVLFLSIADQMQLNAILFCSLQYTAHSSCKRQRYFAEILLFFNIKYKRN